MEINTHDGPVQLVYVVFGGQCNFWWQHFLQPGFTHCFAIVKGESSWILIDPLVGRLMVKEYCRDRDVISGYRRAGFTVLGPFIVDSKKTAVGWWKMLVPTTCVTVCRGLLGVGAPSATTPWQLYQKLLPLQLTALIAFK